MPKKAKAELITVSQFKDQALKFFSKTARLGREYVITRRGTPIAKVSPVHVPSMPRRGSLAGAIEIYGDIVEFDFGADWEVEQ